MDETQLARLIGAIEAQTKLIKKINSAIQLIGVLIILNLLAAGCQALGLI